MNLELEIREILVTTTGLPSVEYVFSYTEIPRSEFDADFFYRQIEQKYNIVLTKAQRETINTVGEVIHYLKLRLRTLEVGK